VAAVPAAEPATPAPPRPRGRRSLLGLASLAGTVWVTAGSVLLGASGYAFLTLTAGPVSAADYSELASLYLLVAMVGPGLFYAVEQESTRLVSQARALGQGTRSLLLQLAQTTAAILLGSLILLAAVSPVLAHRVFTNHPGLIAALAVSVVGYGAGSVVRGFFAGQRRLRGYAAMVGGDGLVRLLPCLALALAGVSAPLPYGLTLALGPAVALLATLAWLRAGEPGPRRPWPELVASIGWLAGAWALSLALANVAPVVVKALLPDEPERAGTFAFAFVLARVPLFVLFSLQAILLPAMTRAAAARDLPGLRRGIRQGLVMVGALGGLALLTTAPVGSWLIDLLLHRPHDVSPVTLTALAAGTVLAMIGQVLQPALLAVAGHRSVAAAWLAGTVCFAAAFALPVDPVAAATIAQIAAGLATVGVLAAALRRPLGRRVTT
jgi:O-antigen/teichoic acid export membrane protein